MLLRSPRQRSGSGSAVASPRAHRDGSTGLSEDAGPAANGSAAAGVDGDPGSVQQQAATGSDAVETQVGRLSQVQLFRGHSMVLRSLDHAYVLERRHISSALLVPSHTVAEHLQSESALKQQPRLPIDCSCVLLQPQTLRELRGELLADCRTALLFVIDRNRHFHRAHHRLARHVPPSLDSAAHSLLFRTAANRACGKQCTCALLLLQRAGDGACRKPLQGSRVTGAVTLRLQVAPGGG